ncbi:MAG: TIR domain-containing protein [Alphaproteobacteria bacterium]|nr:TIR domain-containing protein [Alphaproteobacteria bacterium]
MAGEIFISYRRADQAWARRLHELLRAEGVEAWYDAHVGAGEDWRTATAKALEDSRIFVLLFSQNAAQSSDIAKELAAAVLEKKLIVPVRLENIAPKGAFLYELASRNWINAYDDTDAKLTEVAKGLARLVKSGARDESLLPFERAPVLARSRKPVLIGAAVLVLAVAAALTGWFLWPQPHWTVTSSRPFISTLALEGEPAFSPDGKMLAYTSGPNAQSRKIFVRNVAGGNATRLTNDDYDDISPAWSPDGAKLAYVAVKPGEPCRIMVIAVPAGEARQVGRCGYGQITSVTWQAGTSFLYYYDGTSRTAARPKESSASVLLRNTDFIVRLDLESGQKLILPKEPDNTILDMRLLQCSPDGKSLLFLGWESASTGVLRIRDLRSGKEKVLGKIIIGGSAGWAEDSRSVLTATASGIGSAIMAHPVDGTPAYPVYAAANNVSHLAAGKGGLLALETDPNRQNLARASAKPAAQPDLIDPANGKTWAPTFAPDGTLAFLSNRSGTNAVWTIKPGSAPTLLYDGGLTPLFRLQFSPDGKYLAMPIALEDGLAITILTADGTTVSSFHSPTLGFGAPTWMPNSREVIFFDKRVLDYVRVDVTNPSRRGMSAPPLWGGIIHHGGHIYAARPNGPGYWQVDGGERQITSKYPSPWEPPPALLGDELLVPDFAAAEGARILAQPLSGGADRVVAYAPGAQAQQGILQSGMAANPRTGEIIYVASVQSDTNIDLLTLARH